MAKSFNIRAHLGLNTSGFNKNIKKVKNDVTGLQSMFRKLGSYIAAAFAISELTKFVKQVYELGSATEGVERAFKQFADANYLRTLQSQVDGTISKLQLMQAAVKFNNFNLPLQQLGTLLNFVRLRAQQTGESFEYMFDSMVEGLSKQSKLRIDNLGISIKRLNKELADGYSFTSAVANIATQELEKAGGVAETTQTKVQRLKTAWQDFLVLLYKKISATGIFDDLLNKVDEFSKRLQSGEFDKVIYKGVDKSVAAIGELANSFNSLFKILTFGTGSIKVLIGSLAGLSVVFKAIGTTIGSRLIAAFSNLWKSIKGVISSYKIFGSTGIFLKLGKSLQFLGTVIARYGGPIAAFLILIQQILGTIRLHRELKEVEGQVKGLERSVKFLKELDRLKSNISKEKAIKGQLDYLGMLPESKDIITRIGLYKQLLAVYKPLADAERERNAQLEYNRIEEEKIIAFHRAAQDKELENLRHSIVMNKDNAEKVYKLKLRYYELARIVELRNNELTALEKLKIDNKYIENRKAAELEYLNWLKNQYKNLDFMTPGHLREKYTNVKTPSATTLAGPGKIDTGNWIQDLSKLDLVTFLTDSANAAYALQTALQGVSSAITQLVATGDTDMLAFADMIVGTMQQITQQLLALAVEAMIAHETIKKGYVGLLFAATVGLATFKGVIQKARTDTYAEGGIVSGSSLTGDRVLARVNSGEMILNQAQQANLFKMINAGTSDQVQFKIKGTDLVGVLNNYDRKLNKVI